MSKLEAALAIIGVLIFIPIANYKLGAAPFEPTVVLYLHLISVPAIALLLKNTNQSNLP